jgi:hypothetical protein
MKEKPVKVEVIEETDGRFIVRTYANGNIERQPVVRRPRKKRYPPRPYWNWKFDGDEK